MKIRKAISIIVSLCICAMCIMSFAGCGEKPYVDTSNAAVPGQFDNPEAARAKEAEDDAAGREHIEIPEGAETVEIDGEEYYPIDSLYIDPKIYGEDCLSKNYILTGDVDITGDMNSIGYVWDYRFVNFGNDGEIAFAGKFNGNNYKIYGECGRYIFDYIDGAEIFNFVLSNKLLLAEKIGRREMVFCARVENSVIKNIVNYSRVDNGGGLIAYALNCRIENIINYGDGKDSDAAIIGKLISGIVMNCKNYGNFSSRVYGDYNIHISDRLGGIVGEIWMPNFDGIEREGGVIENCENYGNIIGVIYAGGIVGDVSAHFYYGDDLIRDNKSIIRNCRNYGNIYRNKNFENRDSKYRAIFEYFGGIAGYGSYIENCINEGHIYGFESVHPNDYVSCIGGITGIAWEVNECENRVNLETASAVKNADNICGHIIDKE